MKHRHRIQFPQADVDSLAQDVGLPWVFQTDFRTSGTPLGGSGRRGSHLKY